MHDVTRRLIHKSYLIPIRFRKCPRGIKIMARRRCITSKHIHLTYFFRNRLHVFVRIRILRAVKTKWRLVNVTVGNRHVPPMRIIGRRPKHISRLIKIKSPSIIRGCRHMLHFRAIRFETKKRLRELQGIRSHFPFVTRISHTSPNPVVKSIM